MGEVPLLMPALPRHGQAASTSRRAPWPARPPLVVDLDGTLLRTDVTAESIFVLAKRHPVGLLALPGALLRGRAAFKRALAERAQPDFERLPLNLPLLEFLRAQKRDGRTLVLATGADQLVAHRIAAWLGLFDAVIASDGRANMTGMIKRGRLVAQYGARGFDYAGNSRRDLPVWAAARRAIVAGSAGRHLDAVRRIASVEWIVEEPDAGAWSDQLRTWLTQLRWRHWIKNTLVLVPLLLSHRFGDPLATSRALLATLAFCAAASSVYLINDLIDLPSDRRHPRKRDRPLASGRLCVLHAIAGIPALWSVALLASLALPLACGVVVALYVAAMLAYSIRWKDLRYVDAAVLGGGYTMRVLAGTWAIGGAVDPWLAACCLPTFFGLALLKRRAELAASASHPGTTHARAYGAADARPLEVTGRVTAALGLLALAVLPLARGDKLAATAGLWLACLLFGLWTHKMWRSACAGQVDDDPVAFALRDRATRWIGATACLLLAILA